jgi:hypothetical protein
MIDRLLPSKKGKNISGTIRFGPLFYIVIFALTVMSSIPWLWLMSIDAHWYSTMYSWYTFASTFVAGIRFDHFICCIPEK